MKILYFCETIVWCLVLFIVKLNHDDSHDFKNFLETPSLESVLENTGIYVALKCRPTVSRKNA